MLGSPGNPGNLKTQDIEWQPDRKIQKLKYLFGHNGFWKTFRSLEKYWKFLSFQKKGKNPKNRCSGYLRFGRTSLRQTGNYMWIAVFPWKRNLHGAQFNGFSWFLSTGAKNLNNENKSEIKSTSQRIQKTLSRWCVLLSPYRQGGTLVIKSHNGTSYCILVITWWCVPLQIPVRMASYLNLDSRLMFQFPRR